MSKLSPLFKHCFPSRERRRVHRSRPASGNGVLTLTSLPPELLLCLADFLPPSSVASLGFTSKYCRAVLDKRHDIRLEQDPEEKARFVQMLERDVPHMLACYSCKVLFNWRKKPKGVCPNHDNHRNLNHGSLWCYAHRPPFISRETVDAFLRGYEKGPKYGPQLAELAHECKGDGGWYPTKGEKIARRLDARVQLGKLLLHGVYTLRVALPSPPKAFSPGYVDRSFRHTLLPEIVKFNGIGCVHLRNSLPLLLIDAVHHLEGGVQRPICYDLINCGYCATDLRVRAVVGENACLTIELEMWRSLGGRDPATRLPLEDAHFQPADIRHDPLDISEPPSRNLEDLFNGDFGTIREGPQNRQTWLQVWMSVYGQEGADFWEDLVDDSDSAVTGQTRVQRRWRSQCTVQ
ncbi:uncharacterized protein A1O5_13056 [Cladophialophora psammophila CBS 110553]|uniref:F-box domain-containing protein n=1 Tax=Cladophialophora psammophila CBS 110553 TaxID=1182543 RepID=W9VKZ0_9EURO|nr:uncharacterized protein A1O5_13056 [Cladophialophora psammophila CBS 110553]EXJ53700.1 hypothetical protein A1O5_13056 [Cladophialophora psammophila CBS 110553]